MTKTKHTHEKRTLYNRKGHALEPDRSTNPKKSSVILYIMPILTLEVAILSRGKWGSSYLLISANLSSSWCLCGLNWCCWPWPWCCWSPEKRLPSTLAPLFTGWWLWWCCCCWAAGRAVVDGLVSWKCLKSAAGGWPLLLCPLLLMNLWMDNFEICSTSWNNLVSADGCLTDVLLNFEESNHQGKLRTHILAASMNE